MNTTITVSLPEDIANHLAAGPGDLSRAALEGLALEGYRTGKLSSAQVRRMLGFATRIQVHAFLKEHGVFLHYGPDDLEQDRQAGEALTTASVRSAADQAAFRAMLDRLARKAPFTPELRESTFSRDMIYGEHN
jgi:hypothetical protein